jgi:hypothetical protein
LAHPAPLLVHWAAKGTTKPLRFAPRLTNLIPKTSEFGCYVDDDECDHGLLARLDEQAADLPLCIIRQLLQPVGSNILLDNAVGPSLIGFSIRAQ